MLLLSPLLAISLIAADAPAPAGSGPQGPAPAAAIAPPPPPAVEPTWNLTVAEAIRIGLTNSPIVRVTFPAPGPVAVPLGREASSANIAISRLNRDAADGPFRSAISAHVRSVEQQYWALSSQQTDVWIREATLKLAEEAVRREKADLRGRTAAADLAEAEQAVQALQRNLDVARADRTALEQQFRNILGLPARDQRTMVAVTPPNLVLSQPQWEASLAEMIARNPDIEAARPGLAEAKGDAVAQQKERHDQVVQAATRNLARTFTEIEAQFNHLKTAQRLKLAAQQRLAAQRAFYDEGRITIDRLLHAITQYANAVSQEGAHASTYNTTLAAFEEARGTILPYEGIQITTPPRPEGPEKANAPAEKALDAR